MEEKAKPISSATVPPSLDTISRVRWLLIQLVLLYRATLGRFLGGQCRYQPTCSQYAIEAIEKYGPWRGSWRAVKRICRCHPWGGRGFDPP
jgi:hypothetical protein